MPDKFRSPRWLETTPHPERPRLAQGGSHRCDRARRADIAVSLLVLLFVVALVIDGALNGPAIWGGAQ